MVSTASQHGPDYLLQQLPDGDCRKSSSLPAKELSLMTGLNVSVFDTTILSLKMYCLR